MGLRAWRELTSLACGPRALPAGERVAGWQQGPAQRHAAARQLQRRRRRQQRRDQRGSYCRHCDWRCAQGGSRLGGWVERGCLACCLERTDRGTAALPATCPPCSRAGRRCAGGGGGMGREAAAATHASHNRRQRQVQQVREASKPDGWDSRAAAAAGGRLDMRPAAAPDTAGSCSPLCPPSPPGSWMMRRRGRDLAQTRTSHASSRPPFMRQRRHLPVATCRPRRRLRRRCQADRSWSSRAARPHEATMAAPRRGA